MDEAVFAFVLGRDHLCSKVLCGPMLSGVDK